MFELETPILVLIAVAGFAYLLGSVPFGLVMAKALGLPDPRTIGSKNIGATNVLRTGSKPAALATLLLDGAKGLVAVLAARALVGEGAVPVAALFAFWGHCFSIFLGFKGGKGVATYLGALFGMAWILGVSAALIWLITCLITRYSSLSALMAAGLVPAVAFFGGKPELFAVLLVMAVTLYWRHGENIGRLRAGTESKVGAKSA